MRILPLPTPSSKPSLSLYSLSLSLSQEIVLSTMSSTTTTTTTTTSSTHPLQQIAESPTHKLLLKQWLKEEDLTARRLALKESRIDAVRKEIAALYCAFFVLHSLLILLLLPTSSSSSSCPRSWIPCLTSASLSLALIWAVHYKSNGEAQLEKLLRREREDSLLLLKCVDELKKKGLEFDLLKEVDALRRAKSLRVEAKGEEEKVRKWSPRNSGALFLVAAAFVAIGLNWFVLCSSH